MARKNIWPVWCVLVAGLVLGAAHVRAEAERPLDARQMQGLLRSIQSAAQSLDYSGTFVHQQGGTFRASQISHMMSGKDELEKLEVLDGKPKEYLRKNDQLTRYLPESRQMLVEQRITRGVFPAILTGTDVELPRYYSARLTAEGDRVAGVACQVITLVPDSPLRYTYRLWTDQKTSLLLRAQTLDAAGKVVEQISFTNITIGKLDPAAVAPTYSNTTGWSRREAAISVAADLSGWQVAAPPGFRKIQAVRHVISGASGTVVAANNAREVSQLVYSDGLAAISVFVEPDEPSRTEGEMQQGAMHIVGRRKDGYWLTVMGEVPLMTVRQVINSMRYKR